MAVDINYYATFRVKIPGSMGTEEGERAREKISEAIMQAVANQTREFPGIDLEYKIETASGYIPVFFGKA